MDDNKANIQKGQKGENIATDFLIEKGYKILERNFRTKYGEIDIIASQEDIIAFIEVKSRYTKKYGLPCEAVDKKKQLKIIKSAQFYLNELYVPCRFDIIEVYFAEKKIRHIINAFEL